MKVGLNPQNPHSRGQTFKYIFNPNQKKKAFLVLFPKGASTVICFQWGRVFQGSRDKVEFWKLWLWLWHHPSQWWRQKEERNLSVLSAVLLTSILGAPKHTPKTPEAWSTEQGSSLKAQETKRPWSYQNKSVFMSSAFKKTLLGVCRSYPRAVCYCAHFLVSRIKIITYWSWQHIQWWSRCLFSADILQVTNRGPRVGASADDAARERFSGCVKLTDGFSIVSAALNSALLFPPDKKRDRREIAEEKKRRWREGGKNPWNKQLRGSCLQFPAACCFDHRVLSDAEIERRVEHGHESKPVSLSALGLMRSACRNVGSTPSPRGLLQDGSDGTMTFFFLLAGGRIKNLKPALR